MLHDYSLNEQELYNNSAIETLYLFDCNYNSGTIPISVTDSTGSYSIGSDGTATFTKPNSAAKITIPATIIVNGQELKVTAIADNAFKGDKKLTTVTIGKNAFNGCAGLKTITVKAEKLTSKNVGAGAFKGINKKATFSCPKKQLKAYKKLFVKKGAPKTCKFK